MLILIFGVDATNERYVKKKKRAYRRIAPPVKVETDAERLAADQRRMRVADLYLMMKPITEIAQILAVDERTVKSDIELTKDNWIGRATQDIVQKRAERLAMLDKALVAAWEGWERSIGPRTVTKATKTGPGGQPVTSAVTYKRDGDPRFLALVAKFIDQQARLLALNLQPDDPVQENNASQVVIVLPENYRGGAKQIESEVIDASDVEQRASEEVPVIDG